METVERNPSDPNQKVLVPAFLYDAAEKSGADMSKYVRDEPLPTSTEEGHRATVAEVMNNGNREQRRRALYAIRKQK